MSNEKVINNTQKKGISFVRLMPFLSPKFRRILIQDDSLAKELFNFHSDEAYKTFIGVVREEAESNKENKKETKSLLSKVKDLLK